MNRWRLFLLLLAAFALAAPPVAQSMNHREGKGGFGRMDGNKGGMKGGAPSTSENPMNPRSSRDIQEQSGLFETGLRPVYPTDAECLEVKSHFASPTRFDGSMRVSWAFNGYHNGFDISAPIGSPIIAIADGEVIHKYTGGRLAGHQIFIRHAPEDTGLPVWVYSKYKHFDKLPDLGEVIHKYTGGRLAGHQIFIRHAPEDTGLPVWVYSKYKHFDKLPDLEIGQRVRKGQFLGPSGDTGTAGGHFPTGYPHLHMSIYTSTSGDYETSEKSITPKHVQQVDPVALFLKKNPPVTNSHKAKDLPDAEKDVLIAYMTTGGKAVPEGAKIIWPFACKPK